MPFLRYHTPSRVRQTSSASILPPLVNTMTGLLPRLVPMPGPLVETGSTLVVVCAVAMRVGDAFGDGEGEGDGAVEIVGDGDGGGGESSWVTATGTLGKGCSLILVLNPR